jgi:hypothetical protein
MATDLPSVEKDTASAEIPARKGWNWWDCPLKRISSPRGVTPDAKRVFPSFPGMGESQWIGPEVKGRGRSDDPRKRRWRSSFANIWPLDTKKNFPS